MEANANIKTPLGRRVTPPSTPSASAVLEQARIEGACASDTRRAIARTGSLHYVGESKSIRTGKQLIDGALDTQEVAKVRDLPTQLKWDSEEERKVLASYAMEVLKAVGSTGNGLILSYPKIEGDALEHYPQLASEILMYGIGACPVISAKCVREKITSRYPFDSKGVLSGEMGLKIIEGNRFVWFKG